MKLNCNLCGNEDANGNLREGQFTCDKCEEKHGLLVKKTICDKCFYFCREERYFQKYDELMTYCPKCNCSTVHGARNRVIV